MKRFAMGFVACAVAAFAMPALGAYYVAGDFQGWDPGATIMTDNGDGSWSYTVSGLAPGSRHNFKVTVGDWGTAFPSADSWLYADGSGNASIRFQPGSAGDGWGPDVNRIGVADATASWTAVGSWQHFDAGGADWTNNDAFSVMTPQGGGIYKYSIVIPTPGTYEYKAVNTASWDALGTDSRSVNASTWLFTTTDANQSVDMYANALNGSVLVTVNAVPEPASLGMIGLGAMTLLAKRRRA